MKVNDLNIESIIRKYEHRKEKLLEDIHQNHDYIDTARNNDSYAKSSANTPQFANTITRKDINSHFQHHHHEQTHKKEQYTDRIRNTQTQNTPLKHSVSFQNHQHEALLRKLDEAEEKLVRSERNYAEIWRKYERLSQEKGGNGNGKEVEVEQRLRQKQVGELELRLNTLEKESQTFKECVASKQSNIQILREKLKEKNERLIENERLMGELKSELGSLRRESQRRKDEQGLEAKQKEEIVIRLKGQLSKLQEVVAQKDKEKKKLLAQLQSNYRKHQEQLEILKNGYLKVEEEYKQWVDECNNEKLNIIKEYEAKLNQARASIHETAPAHKIQLCFDEELNKKDQEITKISTASSRQSNEIRQLKAQIDSAERTKSQLIIKLSSLENGMLEKMESYKSLESAYNKLAKQYQSEQEKYKQMRQKYNSVNREFVELKGKCTAMFQSFEGGKKGGEQENLEVIRVRKELLTCREQLERSKNNELALNQKINDAVKTMKERMNKLQSQRQENITELLAERLQNARLKEQIKQTKQYLKKEYELSIENTKKELQNQILAVNQQPSPLQEDPQKQELYLKLRALERKYELLMNQMVTVEEVMSLGFKVQRRYECLKK